MPDIRAAFESLRDHYISYYNTPFELRDPRLARERTDLLLKDGVISREPLIELAPRYVSSEKTISETATDLSLGNDFANLVGLGLLDPSIRLHQHQYAGLEHAAKDDRSFVVTAGTGSGKTETFLLPLLWRLVREATSWAKPGPCPVPWWERPGQWTPLREYETRPAAVRCIILYPMNALVEDQLRRLRIALDSDPVRGWLKDKCGGNHIYFGRFTGRTPGSGAPPPHDRPLTAQERAFFKAAVDRHRDELRQLQRAAESAQRADEEEARRRKDANDEDLTIEEMRRFYFQRTDGAEMISRWDMIAHPPDVLITNYSMLNVMLTRDRETELFDKTRAWLGSDRSHVLTLIVDELHMYRGTAGSEVAFLLRNLRRRLGLVNSDQLRVYAASASLSGDDKGVEYARQFFGLPNLCADDFIPGRIADPNPVPANAPNLDPVAFTTFEANWVQATDDGSRLAIAAQLAVGLGVSAPTEASPDLALGQVADAARLPPRIVAAYTERRPLPIRDIATTLFPTAVPDEALNATYGLFRVLYEARRLVGKRRIPVLPVRAHLFFRNVRGAWACCNPNCSEVDALVDGDPPRGVGKIYLDAQLRCTCGSRVLELLYCEDCGEVYLGGYYPRERPPISTNRTYLLPEAPDLESLPDFPVAGRTHDRYVVYWPSVDVPVLDRNAQGRYTWAIGSYTFEICKAVLEPTSGQIWRADADDESTGWLVQITTKANADPPPVPIPAFPTRCPACGEQADLPAQVGTSRRLSDAERVKSRVRTMGTGFAKVSQVVSDTLLREVRADRLGDPKARAPRLVVFSDSRQDAAKLSTGLEVSHYQDLVRELLSKRLSERDSDLTAYLDYIDNSIDSDAARRWEDANEREALAFERMSRQRAKPEDRAIVDNVRNSLNAPVPLGALYADIERQLLALGVNPAGPGIDDQREPRPMPLQCYPETSRNKPWTDLFDFTVQPPRELPTLNGDQQRLRMRISVFLRAQIGLTLFTSRGRDLESLGLGWVTAPRDKLNIGAYADDIDRDVLQQAFDGAIRILGMKQRLVGGRFYKRDQSTMPAYLRKYLEEVARRCSQDPDNLKRTVEEALRASVMTDAWKLDLEKLAIKPASRSDAQWTCRSCGRLHLHPAGLTCTGVFCRKELIRETPAPNPSIYERDYFELLATSEISPFRLHCEELTGQTDLEDSLSRQQHFQDIFLTDDIRSVQGVDLLSVTTTMEAGVDIGGLQAVMMANMPPRRFNYQQRVGRAGRRADPLSIALTVCRGRTHDDFYFNNPKRITGDPPPQPYIDLSRLDIIRRAASAEALRLAFQARFRDLGEPESDDDDEIFATGRSTHGQFGPVTVWSKHRAWILQWLANNRDAVVNIVKDLLLWDDDEMRNLLVSPKDIRDALTDLVDDICLADDADSRLATRIDRALEVRPQFHSELSELLANRGILPMFGFPTRSRLLFQKPPRRWPITANVIDRDLDIAVGQFAPGSETVKDKAVYTSIGVVGYEPGGQNAISEITDPFAGSEAIGVCGNCHALSIEANNSDPDRCPVCGEPSTGKFRRSTIFQPPGFRTDYSEPRSFDGEFERAVRVTRARLAESATADTNRPMESVKGLLVRSFDDNVYSINDNQGQSYRFARFDREDGYLVPDLVSEDKVLLPNTETQRSLAALSYTNVLLLALGPTAPQAGLNLRPTSLAARAAWYSFAFLVRTAAAELLDVDTNELKVGMRAVRDAQGLPVAEIFISDSLENGAGYASYLAQTSIMEDLLNRIGPSSQSRAGTTFYERLSTHTVAGKLCDSSCHDCLRDYSNMSYHGLLDWRLALDLADLAAGRPLDQRRWLDGAEDLQGGLAGAFGWSTATFGSSAFGLIYALTEDRSRLAYLLTHPLWDTDAGAPRGYAVAKGDAERRGYSVRPITLFDAIRRPGFVPEGW